MLRKSIGLAACLFGTFIAAETRAQQVPPPEVLLPSTTCSFLAVADYDTLEAQWQKTQVGQLMGDAVMQPFAQSLRDQFEDRFSEFRDRLGLTLDDIKQIRGGDVAVAQILPAPGVAAQAVLIDVSGHGPEAAAVLARVAAEQVQRGARKSQLMLGGVPVVVFDLPANTAVGQTAPKAGYFLAGNLLAASNNLEVLEGMLRRLTAGGNDSLMGTVGFQAVMKRVMSDPGAPAAPQIRWFVRPVGYAEVVRVMTPKDKRRKGKGIFEILGSQGFQSIRGVGGLVDFAVEGCELVHRTAIYAPKPYEKSMKMLVFPAGRDFTPEPWVPREIATYSTFYFDILNGFDNFGYLFDELIGEGETGIWEQVLEQIKEDPNGPEIDLREELVVHLGQRISVLTDYETPIGPNSERLLFAIEAKNADALAATIDKWMKKDPAAKRREFGGRSIWEIVEEDGGQPMPRIRIDSGRRVGPPIPLPHETRPGAEEKMEELEEVRLLPHAAITVLGPQEGSPGYLLVASHIDFLLKVLQPRDPREALAQDIDFRLVSAGLDRFGLPQQCGRKFTRTDEAYRVNYELLRQNKMPEAETLVGRTLNRLMTGGKKGEVRQQKVDGSKLPAYDVVRRYLGAAGLIATSEPEGWFFKGVTMTPR